jgi:hypothetical protein
VTNIHATVAAFHAFGPTPGETQVVPAMGTAIPAGTEVRGVEVAGGIATIDLSSEFVSGGGSFSMMGRLAQVVYTLTAFDDVEAVRFEIEGEPATVFGGEGIVVDDPVGRDAFEDLLPAVFVEDPPHWGRGGNPLQVRGSADVFEATVSLALTDGDGLILWDGFTTATCGTGCRGDFEVTIPYEVDEPQMGSLIAWEASARDGSQTNVREHPVWLVPAGAIPSDEDPGTRTFLPDPLPGSDGAHGSGCVVEDDSLPDGVWFGFATTADGGAIDLDLACMWTGEAAVAAAAENGEEAASFFYIRNRSPQTYTVPVAPHARVWWLDGSVIDIVPTEIPAGEWPGPAEISYLDCPGQSCSIWISVEGGEAAEIIEQYLP